MDTPDTPRLWTPLHLELMLHYYVSSVPVENFSAPAQQSYLGELVQHGLLFGVLSANGAGWNYGVTDKGKAFVNMLCRTPLPVKIKKLKHVYVEEWE